MLNQQWLGDPARGYYDTSAVRYMMISVPYERGCTQEAFLPRVRINVDLSSVRWEKDTWRSNGIVIWSG